MIKICVCAAAAIGCNIVHRFRHGPKSQLASTTRWFGSISYIYIHIFSPSFFSLLVKPNRTHSQVAFSPFARYSFSNSRILFRHLIFISFHFRPAASISWWRLFAHLVFFSSLFRHWTRPDCNINKWQYKW